MSRILVRVARAALALVLLVAAFVFTRWWDFTMPMLGHQTYQAVFLSNGQVFFGRYYDRLGPYAKLVSAYYIQQTPDPADASKAAGAPRVIRRGGELHGPDATMLIPKGAILFVEDLAPASPVGQFMAKDAK